MMPDGSIAFEPEVQTAIMRHMNEDHPEDSALMCRALAGQPNAHAARVTGVDREGMDFEAMVGGDPVAVRIPFGRRLQERAEVRTEVVRLYRESCAALGITPREAESGSH